MRYAIIAAGEGSRLAQEGVENPKPLVKVGGEHLIDRLIRIFCDNDATDILIICNEQATQVNSHLKEIEQKGLNGRDVPLRHIVKSTPSSMHSFYELSSYLSNEPFILTTVDTIFREDEFSDYVESFKRSITSGAADGVMGVTDFIDDEKPLYVETKTNGMSAKEGRETITAFLDADDKGMCKYISGGIYGLCPQTALATLHRCMSSGQSRMRNFQRGLIEDGLQLLAYPFSKVLDIDHASDIEKAEAFVRKKKVVGVFRARKFSPNSVENDQMILQLTLQSLSSQGYITDAITEEELTDSGKLPEADIYLSMARSSEALSLLAGRKLINSAEGIALCNNRKALEEIMLRHAIPHPAQEGSEGVWLKRSMGTAETADDVIFCRNEEEEREAMRAFTSRGITDVTRQAHIVGDLMKFYGVAGTEFFHTLYPTDSGRSKFGNEEINGKAHHYAYNKSELKRIADKLAKATGVMVYGGDAIIKADGSCVIIDFNDWPTFSPCREEGASNIVTLVKQYV